MTRLEEVELVLDGLSPAYTTNLCLSLAAEVDELRDQLSDENTNAAAVNDLLVRVQNLTAERDVAIRESSNRMGELLETRDRRMETIAMSDLLMEELARVKAESLRVVADGDMCGYGVWLEQQSSTAFLLDDEVNVHVTINRYQSANGGPSAPIEGDTIVRPVRLERWETPND